MPPAAAIRLGADNFPKWNRRKGDESTSQRVLTVADYERYCNVAGPRGYTFDQALQCGIDTKSGTGMAVPDEESFALWRGFYDKVILAKHGFPPGAVHVTDTDHTRVDASRAPPDLDAYCVSTRIRAARNVSGFGLPPATTRAERRRVEGIARGCLAALRGELAGSYYSLAAMTKEEEDRLQADHFLFQKPNPSAMISGCGGTRDWPDARGIYHNAAKTFLVWVNEEDHLRVISMQPGGDVRQVFKRWVDGVDAVGAAVEAGGHRWMRDPRAGLLSSCVSNLGTGLRASMHVKLPRLLAAIGMAKMEELAAALNMQCRGADGEYTDANKDGKVDLSNSIRIGATEVQLVQQTLDGVCAFIALEKKCEAGRPVDADIAALLAGAAAARRPKL